MHVYLAIFGVAALAAYLVQNRRQSQTVALFFAAFLLLFIGTRGEVGCDYTGYLNRFNDVLNEKDWKTALGKGEGAYYALSYTVRDLDLSYSALLFVCGVLYVLGLWRFAGIARRPMAILALAFPILVLQLGMSGLRQALALACLMCAYRSFVDLRRWWVLFWVLLASQFHTSAILFLPMVFLVGRKISTRSLALATLLGGPVVAVLLEARFEVYHARYVTEEYGEMSSSGAWGRYLVTALPFVVLAWKRRLVQEAFPREFELMRFFGYIMLALLPVGLISSVGLHRLTYYAMPVSLLALLCVSESVFAKDSRKLGMAIPFLAYGTYIMLWFTLSKHASACYVPYETWLL